MSRALKAALIATAVTLAIPAAAQAWTKTYAVEWSEPAMYYGAKTGTLDPGTDCPGGSAPEPNWLDILVKAGYAQDEAEWLLNPAHPIRAVPHGQTQLAFRGENRANVYIHPTSVPESGYLKPVTGVLAEGVNLDGNTTTGFTGLAGEKGIDNNFYKAVGCWKTYRGPQRLAYSAESQNGYMRDGSFTILIVVTGKGADPMNDPSVQVGFYDSSDKLVKDAMGNIARDYTFKVRPSAKYEAIFKAKTVNGHIITTEATPEIWMREPAYTREVQLLKARLDLTMNKDGSLKGYVGGYRPWESVYKSWVNARGNVIESLMWIRLPDVYYALRREADYSPTGPNGPKTHISFAARIDAVPAYVMAPDASAPVTQIASYKSQAKAPEPPVVALNYGIIDGIVVPKGAKAAVSMTPEQLRPPLRTAAK